MCMNAMSVREREREKRAHCTVYGRLHKIFVFDFYPKLILTSISRFENVKMPFQLHSLLCRIETMKRTIHMHETKCECLKCKPNANITFFARVKSQTGGDAINSQRH